MKYFKPIHDFYLLNFNLILPFTLYCIFSLYLIVLSFLFSTFKTISFSSSFKQA